MERENMEESLCVAAITGDLALLHQVIAKDKHILGKVSVGSFKGKNPLHVAISRGKKEFVEKLIVIEPSLAEILDVELGAALHIASAKGNLEIVKALVAVKPEMCLARDRDGNNPLHIASSRGDLEIVKALVSPQTCLAHDRDENNPLQIAFATGDLEIVKALKAISTQMCLAHDRDGRNPLHIASARGDLEIVKVLVMVSPQMCLARDRDGNNPFYIAAMNGKVDVLEELIQTGSQGAKVKVDRGDTILHLCVKYHELQCLKLLLGEIPDPTFVNDVDADGNTILHLAVFEKQREMVKCLLDKNNRKIEVNATNKSGQTALDIHLLVRNPADSVHKDIEDILVCARAALGKEVLSVAEPKWMTHRRNTFMIVTSLIATIAFQTGVNPPGGVWVEDSADHQAGKAILAYKYPHSYPTFIKVNTAGFFVSLSLIYTFAFSTAAQRPEDLLRNAILTLSVLIPTAYAYTYSVSATLPEDKDIRMRSAISSIKAGTIAWVVLVALPPTITVLVQSVNVGWRVYKLRSKLRTRSLPR